MKKKKTRLILLLCLAGAALLAGLAFHFAEVNDQPKIAVQAEPLTVLRMAYLDNVYVQGESACIRMESDAILNLRGEEGGEPLILVDQTDTINNGLILYTLTPGTYRIYGGNLPLYAGDTYLPDGYTLPRKDVRLHWVFSKDTDGSLLLRVSQVTELPLDVYDVAIDPGHGGKDTGATAFGVIEANYNLQASLYMKECLEALGLKVMLTRETDAISGGEAAEDNPYTDGARVDLIYQSHARYVISNHLNASGGPYRGFQIYSSVKTDTRFADAVADALRAAGAKENNDGYGLVGHGVYKRDSGWISGPRDYYFIIRETGGYLLAPYNYRFRHRDMANALTVGAETLLMEYIFLDNADDLDYWQSNWQSLVQATVQGAASYWNLK